MNGQIPTAQSVFFSGRRLAQAELEELERSFFSNLILENGTFKTTNHRRLDDLNALALPFLPPERPLRIMDVAVSSGVSTGEWIDSLQRNGIAHHMTAGDLVVDAFLVAVAPGLRVLVDKTGHALQIDVRGKAIRTPVSRRHFARHPLAVLTTRLCAPLLRAAARHSIGAGLRPGSHRGMSIRPVKLVSTSLTRFPDIEIVEDDILANQQYRDCFHALRAANILNRVYFDDATLRRMLCNLSARLLPGGLLIVCRTDEAAVNNATVFRLNASRGLEVVARLNAGSEIEALALNPGLL
jgi:hypothetical protein